MNGDTSISCNLSNCDCDKPKAPHALTREQCSLCTANRPRLCDQHYKQGADELLKHVTAAIQDQQTPGGVKATYEQLLELCNQQRQALTQQAQEIERLKRDNRLLNEHITCCRAENAEKLSQLAAMTAERDEACGELLVSLDDAPIGSLAGKLVTANRVLRSHLATLQATLAERDAYKAVLQGAEYEQVDKIGTLSVEVAQRIGVTAAHRTKEIVAQLAASQQRVKELELDVAHRDRTVQEHIAKQAELQATLAAREASYDRMRDNWSTAVQETARLREALCSLL